MTKPLDVAALAAGQVRPKGKPKAVHGTIFHQDWWMDAAAHVAWAKVEVRWDNGLVGVLPYTIERRHFTTRIGMPWYSRVLGPLVLLPASKPVKRLSNACKVIEDLMSKLPPHDAFRQRMAPEHDESSAFVMNGYRIDASHYIEQDYTFRIGPEKTPESILKDMHWRTKSHITACEERLHIVEHQDVQKYIHLARSQAEGRSLHRFDLIERGFAAAIAHGQATILSAEDDAGNVMAATILLWDSCALYFWQGARKLEPGNYAYAFVIWQAMRYAHARGLTFDLDGFYSRSAAKYLGSFGGMPVSRPWIVHNGMPSRALALVRDMLPRKASVDE